MTRQALVGAAVVAGIVATVAALSDKTVPEPVRIEVPRVVTHCAKGGQVVCDALETGKKPKYRRVKIGSTDCVRYKLFSDGGVEAERQWQETKSPRKGLEVVDGSCIGGATVTGSGDGGVEFVAQACACRKPKGDCWVMTDAGMEKAPFGKTLGPGYPPFDVFAGDGCVPKACVEFFGSSSWPAECPR